jgi:YHS domain-containing protein/thiol-disulfide isomerase/thioredoxin
MHVKFGALSIGLALCLTNVGLGASAVQWQPTLERAQVVAAHSNRLVLIHFWGNGCRPCEWMEREVFTRPDVAQAIDRGFVAVKINKDQFPNAARQFGVAAVPTDVVITPQGQILGSYVGQAPAAEFVNRLNQAAQRAAPPVGPGYPAQQQGQANAPSAYTQGYPQRQQPQPNANQPVGGAPNGMSQPGPTFPQQQPPSGQALQAQVTPRYSGQYGTGANSPPSQATSQPIPQFGMNAGQDALAEASPPFDASPYPPNHQMPPADPQAQQLGPPSQAPSQQLAATPADGNPPLALDGFCPVSLEKTMRLDPQPKWISGDPRWGLRHEGRTYLFAGPEEQQAFFGNPNFYAPVLSGSDAVLHVEQGWQVQGAREFGARWRDRVYLFSSRENFDKFQANPTFYENEILGTQQAVVEPAQSPGQHVGAATNPPYPYR